MDNKKFQKVTEFFVCKKCGIEVEGDGYTNHCTECFTSMHVDINPGDRASTCCGLMFVKDIILNHGAWVLVHKCEKCGYIRNNKVQSEDNQEKLAELKKKLNEGAFIMD